MSASPRSMALGIDVRCHITAQSWSKLGAAVFIYPASKGKLLRLRIGVRVTCSWIPDFLRAHIYPRGRHIV